MTDQKAIESWKKSAKCANPVTPDEHAAVEQVMLSTWEADKAGSGKDARGLSHTAVKVSLLCSCLTTDSDSIQCIRRCPVVLD